MIVSLSITLDVDVIVEQWPDVETAKRAAKEKALEAYAEAVDVHVVNVDEDSDVPGSFVVLRTSVLQ